MCYNMYTSVLAQIQMYSFTAKSVYKILTYVPAQIPTYIYDIKLHMYIMDDFQQLASQRSSDFYMFIYYKYIFEHFKNTKTKKKLNTHCKQISHMFVLLVSRIFYFEFPHEIYATFVGLYLLHRYGGEENSTK